MTYYTTNSGRSISEDTIDQYLQTLPKAAHCREVRKGCLRYTVGNSRHSIDLDLLLNKQPRIRHRRADRHKEAHHQGNEYELSVIVEFLQSLLDALQKEAPK